MALILGALVASLCPESVTGQEVPTSRWWYPSGTPEATRLNGEASTSQQAGELVIKWKNTALRGARTLLVGALSTPANSLEQQIVGVRQGFDSLFIVDQYGFVDTSFNIVSLEGEGARTVRLTGLFNPDAESVTPQGRPSVIGVAIEREVLSATESVRQAYGILLRPDGTVMTRLGLTPAEADRINRNTLSVNRHATVYPFALYTPPGETEPVALSLLSQDSFYHDSSTAPTDVWFNSLRLYRIPEVTPTYIPPTGNPFRIAPKTWGSQPAVTWLPGPGINVLSLATEAYTFSDTIRSDLQSEASRTQEAAAMHLRVIDDTSVVSGISEYLARGVRQSRSLFARIVVDTINGTDSRFLRFAWDVRENNTASGPRLFLTHVNDNGTAGTGLIQSPDSLPYNGYDLILADLDGDAPGPQHTKPILVNNPGPEMVVTRQMEGSDQIDVMVYRYNDRVPINTRSLGSFTQQRMRGRIVAAGDIVADPDNRQELVQIDRDTLRILQLRSYVTDSLKITPFNPALAEPFAVIASVGLGDTVLTAVIADVEGDGENDIIASTPSGTFLIGRPVTRSFEYTIDPAGQRLCPSDTLDIAWSRRTVGGGAGIRVMLIGPNGVSVINRPGVLTGNRLTASPFELNITISGEYRLVVSDAFLPHLSDTSSPFTFLIPQLGELDFAVTEPQRPGTMLVDTIAARCVDEIELQWSVDSVDWRPVTAGEGGVRGTVSGDSAAVTAILPCPGSDGCGRSAEARFAYYRLVTPGDTGSTMAIPLELEVIELAVVSEDTVATRSQEIIWEASSVTCDELVFRLRGPDSVYELGTAPASAGSFVITPPEELTDSASLCVSCSRPDGCLSGEIEIRLPPKTTGDYIAPNPFSPRTGRTGENGATIVYTAKSAANVTIRIIDAGRSTLREIVQEKGVEAGRHRETWDGTDRNGETLANGTYFCVISFSTGENIILPFVVIQ